MKYLKDLEESQFYSSADISSLQRLRLKSILIHAYQNVPYYQQAFDCAGIKVAGIETFPDFLSIPVLTKKNIQENLNKLVAKDLDKKTLIKDKTGGSTASPINFFYDVDRLDWRKAATTRHDKWAGFDIGIKHAILWGARSDFSGLKKLRNKIYKFLTTKQYVLDASSIDNETLKKFTRDLMLYKPKVLLAYARTLSFYARYLEENKITPPSPNSIITSAELLTDEDRFLIEEVFKTKIYNRYGCREFAVLASECEYGNMHINDECYYLEFLRSDGTLCKFGEEGEIVITDLFNTSMPMIRYKIGDTGMMVDGECKCGRGLRIMKMISGRVTDFLISSSGKYVSGVAVATYIITNIEGINQVQFIQNDINSVDVLVVGNSLFDETKTLFELEVNIKKFLEDTHIIIKIVDAIPLTESGKMQFCINKVSLKN
ncbi:phenylacetate--CoA ligase family protein [Candidatus Omnitrophota bacterium]